MIKALSIPQHKCPFFSLWKYGQFQEYWHHRISPVFLPHLLSEAGAALKFYFSMGSLRSDFWVLVQQGNVDIYQAGRIA
jgi:hypothetical protein